jgi:hypothetical protein
MFVKHLQEYLDQFTDGKRGNAISNANIEHLGSGTVKLFRGSRIMELEACGFKLDACRLGLDACRLELEACGL